MSVLIKGGRVVTAADDYVADVFVEGERVTLIGESLDVDADKVIDASGKYLLPGGVDPHTHLDMPFGGTTTIDDVESGQTAAAFGGTTTHVDFCIQGKGQTLRRRARGLAREGRGQAADRHGLPHRRHRPDQGGALEELATLPDQGVTSYKLFMAYKGALHGRRRDALPDDGGRRRDRRARDGARRERRRDRRARQEGARRGPHRAALARAHAAARDRGRGDEPRDPARARRRLPALRRPRLVQASRSSRSRSRATKGWDVWGETCTQYFFVDYTFLERPNFEGAKYVYTPPPRDKANQDVLWDAVRTDVLCAISTDHCAFNWDGQKTLGRDDFSKIPNGGPGLENRLQMIHHFGVREGRITLNRMVELLATNPAKLFGLYPRKGTLAVGSDADIVVFDPEKRVTISAATHHSKIDYNLYEGTEVVGSPEIVLLRGNVLVENGELVAAPGIGRFVARARSSARSWPPGAPSRPDPARGSSRRSCLALGSRYRIAACHRHRLFRRPTSCARRCSASTGS